MVMDIYYPAFRKIGLTEGSLDCITGLYFREQQGNYYCFFNYSQIPRALIRAS